ncbi:ComF family protein [Candidatus Berkelbacteria bacterium]|nr:ComF family protein [Candidatus Berkelbacteria bacterium]
MTRGPGRLCDRDRQRVGLTGLVAYGDYHAAPLARAIAGIKYDGYFAAVPALTQLAADHWSVLGSAGSTTIIPIPLARKRLRERGFNQAELLTRTLSQLLDTPVETALVRSRETTSQVGLGRTERAANVVDAFTWRGNPLHGAVVLVDDVVTTGATLGSAAQTLRAHGAREVWAATLAVER